MVKRIKFLIVFSILFTILLLSLFSVSNFNTDFGKVTYSTIMIETDYGQLTGLLYKPTKLENQQFPGIVVAHGISESAQILSGLGLELSRAGFVVICLDLPGHGGSDGSINQGGQDPALGIDDAVNYLSNLSYVDSTRIGLVGHSLGAGAVRAANTKLSNVNSLVLIGGGVSDAASGIEYGPFNATYPKNVLVVIGKYDVLFDIPELINKNLLSSFNTTGPIQQEIIYGDLNSQ
jgi:dienelactone hydrolase